MQYTNVCSYDTVELNVRPLLLSIAIGDGLLRVEAYKKCTRSPDVLSIADLGAVTLVCPLVS